MRCRGVKRVINAIAIARESRLNEAVTGSRKVEKPKPDPLHFLNLGLVSRSAREMMHNWLGSSDIAIHH